MKYVGRFLGVLGGVLVLIVISCLIPHNWMRENMQEAVEVLAREGQYPKGGVE